MKLKSQPLEVTVRKPFFNGAPYRNAHFTHRAPGKTGKERLGTFHQDAGTAQGGGSHALAWHEATGKGTVVDRGHAT